MSLSIGFVCRCGHETFSTYAWPDMFGLWEFLGCYDALYNSNGKRVKDILPELLYAAEMLKAHSNEDLRRFDVRTNRGKVQTFRPWFLHLVEKAEKDPNALVWSHTIKTEEEAPWVA